MKRTIIVIHRDDLSFADNIFLVSLKLLHSLEVVRLIKRMVIPVTVKVWVVIDILVPPEEGVIDEVLGSDSHYDLVLADGEPVVNLEGRVLQVHTLIVDARLLVSAAETLLHTVLMDGPHSVHFFVDVRIEAVAGDQSRSNQPEHCVLCLQLEYSCKIMIIKRQGLLTSAERHSRDLIKCESGSSDSSSEV